MTNREPSKYNVNVLNLNNLAKNTILFLIENGYETNGMRLRPPFFPLGIITDDKGKHYLIDNEGVGTFIPLEDEEDNIEWCADYYGEDGKIKGSNIYPIAKTSINLEEALDIPVEKVVRLDEFIRIFGDRLERNLLNVEKFLSGKINRDGNRVSKA